MGVKPAAERGPQFGEACREDLPQLVELLGMLFSQEADFSPDADKQARGLAAILDNPLIARIHVVREGGRVLGMLALMNSISTAEGGPAVWLEDLVLRPECRGRGLGRALLRHAIAVARAEGQLRISLLTDARNERAQALYASEGFDGSAMKTMRLKLPRR